MGSRGRKSSGDLAVVENVVPIARAQPPAHLGSEQAREWTAIVNAFPADHFPRERHPLLEAYCNHTANARRIAGKIEEKSARGELDTKGYKELLSMYKDETAKIGMLAVRLGFAYSTAYEKRKKGDPADITWDD